MAVTVASVADTCAAAKQAAPVLAALDSGIKNAALHAVADTLERRSPEILDANSRDLAAGREAHLTAALLDRLSLDERRVAEIARQVRDIASLPDPVGEVIERPRGAQGPRAARGDRSGL